MKKGFKRALSIMLAMMMLCSLMQVSVFAAAGEIVFLNANDAVVNETATGIASGANIVSKNAEIGSSYAPFNMYSGENILGLTDGDKAIVISARDGRSYFPTLSAQEGKHDIDKDFYLSQNVYLSKIGAGDYFILRGVFNNTSGGNSTHNLYLSGYNDDSSGSDNYSYGYDGTNYNSRTCTWENSNWYNFTMAATYNEASDDYTVKFYLDGKQLKPNASNNRISYNFPEAGSGMHSTAAITEFGLRFDYLTGSTPSTEQWAAVKDIKFTEGTYSGSDSNTALESGTYTINNEGVVIYNYKRDGHSSSTKPKNTVIEGVAGNTTVASFLGNITLPANATAKVVTFDGINSAKVDDDAYVTSEMKLVVTAKDGAMKLYDISAAASTYSDTLVSSNASYSAYVVDNASGTITVPDTKVSILTSRITVAQGASVKVLDHGYEVEGDKPVATGMTLVAEKAGAKEEYAISIANNTNFFRRMADINMWKNDLTASNKYFIREVYTGSSNSWGVSAGDGCTVRYNTRDKVRLEDFGVNNGAIYNHNSYLFDKDGGKVTATDGASVIYDVDNTAIPGVMSLKVEHSAGSPGWSVWRSDRAIQGNKELRDKTIVKFQMNVTADSAAVMNIHHSNSKDTMTSTSDMGSLRGDSIGFIDGKILLGAYVSGGVSKGTEIGTFTHGTPFDITIVEATPDKENGSDNVTIEAIYVDDTKVYPAGDQTGVISIASGKNHGLQYFELASLGTVYWGDIQFYMADDYTPEEVLDTNLAISSASLDIEGTNIYGWEGLDVAGLKAAITHSNGTALKVVDQFSGSEVKSGNVSVNMYLVVTDKTDSANTANYKLFCNNVIKSAAVNGKNATKKVLIYTAEADSQDMTMIFAGYDASKNLVTAIPVTKTVKNPGDYVFTADIEEDFVYYSVFFWDMETLTPIDAVVTNMQ